MLNGNRVELTLDVIYPVGSIYMSMNSTNPATLFGGTWEQIQNTFLLAAGTGYTAGTTGGEASHTLTVDEMPSHKHDVTTVTKASWTQTSSTWAYLARATANDGTTESKVNTYVTLSYTGGSAAHNNMPPFLAVYMWKRTA